MFQRLQIARTLLRQSDYLMVRPFTKVVNSGKRELKGKSQAVFLVGADGCIYSC